MVEDDEDIAQALQRSLRMEGYEVRTAADESERAGAGTCLSLPQPSSSTSACRGWTASRWPGRCAPTTTCRSWTDRPRRPWSPASRAWSAGADDYLVKPFERQELWRACARCCAAAHRVARAPLRVGDLVLNADTHEVLRGERTIELTQREFELLEYLMRNERIVISRQRLLDEVWGYDPFSTTNTIEVFVSNLRRKLEAEKRSRGCCTRSGEPATSFVRRPIAAVERVSAGFDRLPIRIRLAGVSALLMFVILCAFALAIGSLTVHRIRSDFNRQVYDTATDLPHQMRITYEAVQDRHATERLHGQPRRHPDPGHRRQGPQGGTRTRARARRARLQPGDHDQRLPRHQRAGDRPGGRHERTDRPPDRPVRTARRPDRGDRQAGRAVPAGRRDRRQRPGADRGHGHRAPRDGADRGPDEHGGRDRSHARPLHARAGKRGRRRGRRAGADAREHAPRARRGAW